MIKKWPAITGIAVLVCLFVTGTSFVGASLQRIYSGQLIAPEDKARTGEMKSAGSIEPDKGASADEEGSGRASSDEYKGRLWVSQKPFQPYPTEEQLFAEPSGTVEISGIKADSYAKGMEVSWRANNWEFYAAGHFEQDGVKVAEEVLEALKGKTDVIPGAVKGKLRAARFGNPMFVTISWTYDDKIWYELHEGKGSPELMVKMLEAAAKNRNPAVLLKGEPFQNTAELRDGSLFLPLRAVCEALGFAVQWSERDNTVTVARGDRNIVLNLTVPSINVDGGEVSPEGKYIAIDGSTYMEESFFSGYLGIQVKRDEATRRVTLLPEPIPLHFAPAENSQAVRMEQKAQIGKMMGGDMAHVEGINAYMYIKAEDSEDLHGGYGGKDGLYDLGPVGSLINSGNDLTCVRTLQLYGKTLIKFQGVFGSHVLRTNYFAVEDGVPKPFLSVDGLTTEMDVDGDGKKEIVAELSGTIPSVNIFEGDGKALLASSVDKALGAGSVEFNREDGSFRAYYKTNAQENSAGIAYQYTGNGLELKKADREVGDVLSENVIDYDGDSAYEKVIVRMTEGNQYEDEAAGPFMGWNWQGKFVVQLLDVSGKMVSALELNKIFNPNGEDMIFNGTFRLQFNDYNNDGFPDFALGQYGSSNGNLYRLFTVKNGKIEPLPVKNGGNGELFSSGGRSRYAREFDKFAKSGFINRYYNNALGKNIRQNFVWDGAQFVIKPGDGEDGVSGTEKDKNAAGPQTQFYNKNPDIRANDVISQSPDGRFIIAAHVDEEAGQYQVLLYNAPDYSAAAAYEIVGRSFSFLWTEDSSKVSISYSGRQWINLSVLDMASKAIVEIPSASGIMEKLKADGMQTEALRDYRPDPYVLPVEWAPDNNGLLAFYEWTDQNNRRQNGFFVYDMQQRTITKVIQNPPAEGEHVPFDMPEGFQW